MERWYHEAEIRELISSLDNMYRADASSYANELDRLVGDMSPYGEGDELTEDDADLVERVENYIDNQ